MRRGRAGRYRDRLTIQTEVQTSGEYGGYEPTWTDDKSRSCDIMPLRASEFIRSGAESVDKVVEIRFRYERDLLDETKRLVDTRKSPNVIYDIQAVINPRNYDTEYVVTAIQRKWPIRE